jgi:phenylalanyl-tRNA synthetase beta chain
MKYSFPILKKFISVNDNIENISKNLILKTVEIENIEKREIDNLIVIGLVNKCQRHTDADKLNVCEVNC